MLPDALQLADAETMSDLRTFLARARTVEDGQARIQVAGAALAVYVPVLAQEAIGGTVPTILGLRVAGLASGDADGLVAVYELGALTDRLARAGDGATELPLPPAESRAAWAGITPPLSGWTALGEYDDDALAAEAESGMRAVAEALPPNAGRPVLDTVRGRIWSAASQAGAEDSGLPLGAAFAAESLGFLRSGARSRLHGNGRWLRLTSTGGHTLVRYGVPLM